MRITLTIMLLATIQLPLLAQAPRELADLTLRRALGTSNPPSDAVITGERRPTNGPVTPFRMVIRGNRKVRYEIGTGNQMQVSIFNNGAAWRGVGNRFEAVESFGVLHRPAILPFADALSEPIGPTMILYEFAPRPVGTVTARHLRVRHLDPTPERRFQREPLDEQVDLFIDPSTLLVMRTERVVISDSNYYFRVPVAFDYSDYRNVEGIAVPFRIIERVGTPQMGLRETTLILQTVRFNQAVPDSAFLPQ